jgi:hypothetical protein
MSSGISDSSLPFASLATPRSSSPKMKLFTLLPLSLLSLAATLPADTAPGMTHWDKRSNVWCDVTGKTKGANVHCRAGPSTDSKHVRYVKVGDLLRFTCYKSGECIDGNW